MKYQPNNKSHRIPSPHLVISSAVVLAAMILSWSTHLSGAAEYRAFWVDGWGAGFLSQSQVDALLGVPGNANSKGTIRDANCNMVIVQVRRRYDVCYPSGVGEPYMSMLSPANFNALQAMINAAHDTTGGKKRIEVHCWQVTFATGGGTVWSQHIGTPTGSLTSFDNYWPTRDDSGNVTSDYAFDPGHPLMLQYIVNATMDQVNNFDIDGVHYDYIRFTANNQGYNPTSIARYNARYATNNQPIPSDPRFMQWRRDQVTAVVRQVYARIQKSKPWVKQSGSFVTWNPSPTTSTRAGFQATRPYYDVYSDWDSWMQEGIVDMAVPMTYYDWASLPSDYTKWINFEKDRKFNRHMIIGPGTYLNYLSDAILELQMTREASPAGNYADGFSGYSYRSPYSTAKSPTRTYGTWAGFTNSFVPSITPTWDDIPDMPWKSAPTNGHIMGTVTIAGTGAWADGAKVSLTGPVSRVQTNDGTGFYAFIDLPPGSYTVTASKSGYANASAVVNVAIGAVTGNMYEQNLMLGGNAPPVIFNVQATAITAGGATITWATDVAASSQVEYGPTSSYGTATPLDSTAVNSHSASLSGLAPNALYHYRVVSANTNGTTYSVDYTFTTSGPPSISNVQATDITASGATITWTTDAPADSQVRYGLTSSYDLQTPVDSALVRNHSVNLSGLAPTTAYHYQVLSANAYGSTQSLDLTFTTAAVATEIVIDNTDPGWSNTSPGGATWTTGSSGAVPKIGDNYLYTGGTGSSSITRSCRWTPEIGVAGFYDVYVFYQIGQNRTLGATYRVTYDGGTVSSLQNQYSSTPNQGGWFLVGTNLLFAPGTGGYVELGNDAVDTAYVSADATKFVLVAPITPPAITVQPQPPMQNVNVGQSATFTVTASGSPTPTYQWRLNGTNLAGATTSAYTRTDAQPEHAGSYSVVVTNIAGSVTSSNAVLTVNVPPAITAQPQSLSVKAGSNATFTVSATGTAPLGFQWRFNGTNLADATTSAYTCWNAQTTNTGSYSVVVSNIAGTVVSTDALLTVTQPQPPGIDWISLTAQGYVQLQASGDPGHYAVDATTNLIVVDWVELTNFTTTAATFQYTDGEANLTQRFYRVRLIP